MLLSNPKKIRRVYLDHAATTPVDLKVLAEMKPYFSEKFGNPSALYGWGREAQKAVSEARKKIAGLIHALPENVVFVSGGSEANNLAILGLARVHEKKGKHIISIGIEHHAALKPLNELKRQGFEITFVPINKEGLASAEAVLKAIRPDTILITIMFANNEMGAIQPIAEIGRGILRYRKEKNTPYPYFHSDACQAAGYLDLDVEKTHLDLMSVNGSKIYGPKGIGFLYLRRGVKLQPIIFGGGQEKGLRAGTENVPGIVGLAKALEIVQTNKEKESSRERALTVELWQKIQKEIPNVRFNGPAIGENRLPNNLNVSFHGVEGEALLLYLDEVGVMCSTGSACTSESLEPSHVLKSMGLSDEAAHGSLRFTFGRENVAADVDYVIKYLPAIVKMLKEISTMK